MSPIYTMWLSMPQVTQDLLPYLCPNPMCIWWLARYAFCTGQSIQVQLAVYSQLVTNWPPRRAHEILCLCVTAAYLNQVPFDYFLGEKSLAASVIVLGWYTAFASAPQMMSVMVWRQSDLFGALQWPEPSIRPSHTVYISHACSRLHPPILVQSIRQGSPPSAEHSSFGAVLLWGLCPSLIQVSHLHSTCHALSNLQDRSDCVQLHSMSAEMIFQAF